MTDTRTFSGNIDTDLEHLRSLVAGIPPESRRRAKGAAVAIETVILKLQKDYPKDPAVALGVAFAVFMIASRMIEQDEHGDQGVGSLIQLLN